MCPIAPRARSSCCPQEVTSIHDIALHTIEREDAFHFVAIPERRMIRFPYRGSLIHAPTAALVYQFLRRVTRTRDLAQPVVAWK